MFSGIVVARLPFEPYRIFQNFISYNLTDVEINSVSAPFLFVLLFITFKQLTRKCLMLNTLRLLPQGQNTFSIPRSMLFKRNISNTDTSDDSTVTLLCQMLSWWYSIYSLYKALKKYRNFKYIVSITRVASRITGIICATYVPKPIRYVFYGSFAKFYGVNMDEVEVSDLGHYETFTKFFTRKLKEGARTIDEPKNEKTMCSPCDGRVLTCGKINA